MLPKSIYESLPYINFTIGVVLICRSNELLTVFSGLLFFTVGAIMWTSRSDHRRRDHLKIHQRYSALGREIYELKPFFYVAFGLVMINWQDSLVLSAGACSVALFGLFLLFQRSLHRRLTA